MAEPSSKVTILFVQAAPPDQAPLALSQEYRLLDKVLQDSDNRDVFNLKTLAAARVTDLEKGLRRFRPQVVHFAGHGSSCRDLVFSSADGDTSELLSAEQFAEKLRIYQDEAEPKVRLAVLAGCATAEAAHLLAQYVDCAIGMSTSVDDRAMVEAFTPGFYAAFGDGRSATNARQGAYRELERLGFAQDAAAVCLYERNDGDAGRLTLAELAAANPIRGPRHLDYLARWFDQSWRWVKLADLLRGHDSVQVDLLDVYVPLQVDFGIRVTTQDQVIVDWEAEPRSEEPSRERLRAASEANEARAALEGEPKKLREWPRLRVSEAGLERIVTGIQKKLRDRRADGEATEDGSHDWFMEAQDAASVQAHFVLLGAPGSGKTSFLRHLALCHAGELLRRAGEPAPANANIADALNKDWLLGPYTPLYIELRALVKDENTFGALPVDEKEPGKTPSREDFWRFVRTHVLTGDLQAFESDLRRLFAEGKVLLLLDGLDEVPEADDPGRRRQRQIQALIASLVERNPGLRIIVSGRPHAYGPGKLELDGFGCAELRPLDRGRLSQLAEALLPQAVQADGASAVSAVDFMQAIDQAVSGGRIKNDMYATPLFFTMLAALWLANPLRNFPDSEAALYRQAEDLLLDRYTRKRLPDPSVVERLHLSPEQLRHALQLLACNIHAQSEPGQDATVFTTNELSSALWGVDIVPRWLADYLSQHAGILVSPDAGKFQFLHRSFQEHLAACELTCTAAAGRRRVPPVAEDCLFPQGLVDRVLSQPDR